MGSRAPPRGVCVAAARHQRGVCRAREPRARNGGYLVVRGRWFALEQRSPRGYTLLTEEVLGVVNTMIRVPWVLFNGSAAGKAPRESRSGLYILGEEWYNRLLESV